MTENKKAIDFLIEERNQAIKERDALAREVEELKRLNYDLRCNQQAEINRAEEAEDYKKLAFKQCDQLRKECEELRAERDRLSNDWELWKDASLAPLKGTMKAMSDAINERDQLRSENEKLRSEVAEQHRIGMQFHGEAESLREKLKTENNDFKIAIRHLTEPPKCQSYDIEKYRKGLAYNFALFWRHAWVCSKLVAFVLKKACVAKRVPFRLRKTFGISTGSPQDFYNDRKNFKLLFERR